MRITLFVVKGKPGQVVAAWAALAAMERRPL